MHACEWIGPATVVYIADVLLSTPEVLDEIEVHLAPVINVDGYVHSWHQDRFWRNCLSGVNPNLNFPTGFGKFGLLESVLSRSWSSDSPLRCGETPLSEPCCSAVAEELRGLHDLHVFIDFHSYGQKWGYPHARRRGASRNEAELRSAAGVASRAAKAVNGREYEVIRMSDYECVGGTIMDWVHEELRVPYSFTVELRPALPERSALLRDLVFSGEAAYHNGFALPEKEIEEVGREMGAAVLSLLRPLAAASAVRRRPP